MSINVNNPSSGGGGVSDHAALTNLGFVASGHTGFEADLGTGTGVQFLRGDKTWAAPAGGGDVTTAITGSIDNTLVVWSGTSGTSIGTSDVIGLVTLSTPGVVASMVTGALTGTSPVTVGGCQVLGAAAAISVTTAHMSSTSSDFVVADSGGLLNSIACSLNTGAISGSAPVTVTAGRRALGGALAIGLDTVPVSKGGTNATSFEANKLIAADGAGTTLITSPTDYLVQVTTGSVSGTAPVNVTAARQALGGALAISLTTAHLVSSSSDLVIASGGTGAVLTANATISLTTGALTATTPITVGACRVLGGAAVIAINTANMVVYAGATSALAMGNQQLTSTGLVNFRSATVCVQTGTAVTLTSAGALCVDTSVTTGAMLGFYADAQYRLPAYQTKSFVIDTPDATADYILWKVPYNITLKSVDVVVTAGINTSVAGFLDESTDDDGGGATACSSDVTALAGTSMVTETFDNATIAAGNYLKWHTTSGGTANSMCCTFTYTVDAV